MTKTVQLKLSKIKYSGDSIGRDIRLELEVLGKFLRIDKRIRVGMTAEVNQEVGRFETDRELFQADFMITIIERDLLFNDVGSAKGNIKINTVTAKPQQFVFEVQVREMRSMFGKFWGTKTAAFEIMLEAEASDAIKYTPDVEKGTGKGWLKVKFAGEPDKSLPAYIKLKIERVDAKREYFTILEGAYRSKFASVEISSDSSLRLTTGIKHEPSARVTYSVSKKVLTLKGKRYKADDDPKNLWKKGLYDIEIPDHPHRGGLNYPEAGRGTVWFRIGHSGERYLHPGRVSAGCISITETTRWMEIYNTLIKSRKGDFMSVGVLEVVD
ncbi:MAG: hypothetical protein UT16_C0004G0003 [Candidatus Azambacteria bacterium GW2011_GWA2_39_10]|uniref:Uncharacterized protein n=1 Tax=Candidatus Azambacteria bacterium GW2011_GWA2_39_10 TaxID=1618611 RepID=A0A0G0P3Z7_9BACT|nr:MAG: hypothetical protein UT16_C0004G0003 [Candidatus Azambacteria bacterium GW2011_GWA2_39_10]